MRLVLDTCVVDTHASLVHRRGRTIALGGRETALLEALASTDGPMTRADLARAVWARDDVSSRTVDRLVQRVRAKVGDSAGLNTIVGVGYELERAEPSLNGAGALLGRTLGRHHELERLHRWMQSGSGAFAVVGPGGIGKTRMALEAAAAAPAYFRDGVVFVPLETVSPVSRVPAAIRAAAGARPATRLEDLFWQQDALIVLDNLEHLSSTELLVRLSTIPGPRLLLTSQVVPNVPGIEVLDLPGLDGLDGLALFEDRAHRLEGLDGEDRGHATAMVELVEGSPLAIELVAAQCRDRSILEVRARMQASLGDVGVDYPDMPARQRSLRAAYAHSAGMLSPMADDALGRVCVFKAPFTAHAARVVVDVDPSVLRELVGRSLLREASGRFALHPSIRACASEKGRHLSYRERHIRWVHHRLAELPNITSQRGERILELIAEFPDVAAAWRAASADRSLRPALEGLGELLLTTHRVDEARDLLGPLTDHSELGDAANLRLALVEYHVQDRSRPVSTPSPNAPLRDQVLHAWLRGMRQRAAHQAEPAGHSLETAAQLARQAADPGILAQVLCNLGSQYARLRQLDASRCAFDEAHHLADVLGDPTLVALVLLHRAWLHIWAFRFDDAERDLVEADALQQSLGDLVQVVTVRSARCTLARILGDDDAEIGLHLSLLELMDRARIRSPQRLEHLGRLAVLHTERGDRDEAERWTNEVRSTAALLGTPAADLRAVRTLTELHWLNGRWEECLALCDNWPESVRPPLRIPELRVLCLHALGRQDDAVAALPAAIEFADRMDPAFRGPVIRAIAFQVTAQRHYGIEALSTCVGRGEYLIREVVQYCGGHPSAEDLEGERQRLLAQLSP